MKTYDVLIVGGGAAGMFAALQSAKRGFETAVVEKNDILGKKLLITGKGRCNVTNNCDLQTVLDNIPTNSRFLYSALNSFSPQDTMEFFESMGVKLKTERGNRVFPVSDKAQDIVNALKAAMKTYGVTVILDNVRELLTDGGAAVGVRGEREEYGAKKVLIATGGASYPKTGSTGDGYDFAKRVGHAVTPIRASLVPLETVEKEPAMMMGLSLRNVTLSLYGKGQKPLFSEQGEMLFTHFGVSGPLVLSASARMKNIDSEKYKIVIDLKPALDEKTLDKRIVRDFLEAKNRDFQNSLGGLLPQKMVPVIVALSGIPAAKKVNEITKEERAKLVFLLKNLTFNIKKMRPVSEGIITGGGVCVKEINPKTMQSKLIKNLYFAGEVIDADAYTGGFNLQIAFSTAYAFAANLEIQE